MNLPYQGREPGRVPVESHHCPQAGQAAATGAVLLAGFITLLLSGRPAAVVPFLAALVIIEVPWSSLWQAVHARKTDPERKGR